MTALALIPLAAIALALLYQPKRPERIGYVERTARGMAPMIPPKPWQRINRWASKYGQTTVEQRIDPGTWPFTPTAVHAVKRSELTDVRELVR
ncbi:TPA_asm: hypothetical protein Cy-LDV1_g35 [Cyanophage Cy-LDV1]|nr:TPA_asm: hypothetical protein Cy-LDV1_g35 [Cyanophage Cy-LDV1]